MDRKINKKSEINIEINTSSICCIKIIRKEDGASLSRETRRRWLTSACCANGRSIQLRHATQSNNSSSDFEATLNLMILKISNLNDNEKISYIKNTLSKEIKISFRNFPDQLIFQAFGQQLTRCEFLQLFKKFMNKLLYTKNEDVINAFEKKLSAFLFHLKELKVEFEKIKAKKGLLTIPVRVSSSNLEKILN